MDDMSRRCVMIFVMPYPCQCYKSVRRRRPAGDQEAGLMPVDAQDIRVVTGLHKWLLGI